MKLVERNFRRYTRGERLHILQKIVNQSFLSKVVFRYDSIPSSVSLFSRDKIRITGFSRVFQD